MLLAIDCGNTHIVLGVYQGQKLLSHWRLQSNANRTEDEYLVLIESLLNREGLNIKDINHLALGTVVPTFQTIFMRLAKKYLNITPLCIDYTTDTGMPIFLDNPAEAGADRIINAVAAYAVYGGPLIVVDFGTATTFDCVSQKGEFLGGAIAPGIEISQEALFSKAARLFQVPLSPPEHVIGKNTQECLQAGLIWGFAGQVDGLIRRMQQELGQKAYVVATGGLAKTIADYTETIDQIDPMLTLEGLRLIYERNMS